MLTSMAGLTLFLDRLAEARTREIAWRETVAHFEGLGFPGVVSLTCGPDPMASVKGSRRVLASVEAPVAAVCEDRAAALRDRALAHMASTLRPLLLTVDEAETSDAAHPLLLTAAARAGYGGVFAVPIRAGGLACAAGMILLTRHAPAVCRDLVDGHGLALAYAASQAQLRLSQFGDAEPGPTPALTTREREVLTLSAHGMTTREVAQTLGISVSGVNFHISNASRKLGANNRTHATSLAIAGGLIAV